MASSDYPPEVSGCLVFSIEALCFLILKRLPVKSLCRFRCVCRSWNSLITSPSFVSEHFSFVASAPEKSYLLLNDSHHDRQRFTLYHPHKSPQNQVTYLDYPFQAELLGIVDVIHGVVFLQSYILGREPPFLWNPSTRKHHIIPPPHFFHRNYARSLGFGFQSSKGDFKVVSVSYHSLGPGPVCEVLSLQSGLWVAVASDDSTVCSSTRILSDSCFLSGTVHWTASFPSALEGGEPTYALICFDCERDKLSKMELPQVSIGLLPDRVHRYGGKLSVYYSSYFGLGDGALELWAMDRYGVVSSWNMLFRIGHPANLGSIVMRGEDGDILVYDNVRALAKKTKKRLRNRKPYLPVIAGVIEESLYSFEQTSQVPKQQEDYSVYEKLARSFRT